jgi:hypothetical protein
MFFRNVNWHSTDYTALYPRRLYYSYTLDDDYIDNTITNNILISSLFILVNGYLYTGRLDFWLLTTRQIKEYSKTSRQTTERKLTVDMFHIFRS